MARQPDPKPGEGITKHVAADGTVTYWARVARTVDGKRVYSRSTHRTLTAAREWRVAALAATEPPAPRATVPTLAEAAAAHAESKAGHVRATTLRGYRESAKRVAADPISRTRADRLDREDIEGFVARLAERSARHTVNATLVLLRASLQTLLDDGKIRRNPAARVVARGRTQQPAQSFTAQEREALAAAVTAHPEAAVWRFVLIGLRRSEVLGLTWDCIDRQAGTVTIRASRTETPGGGTETNLTKTRRGTRTLPLTPEHLAELAAHADRQLILHGEDRDPHLWLGPSGQPLHPASVRYGWARLCKAAGVRALPLKAARSTSVTAMREAGVPLPVVAAWHGHTETMSANVYTAVDVAALTRAVGWGR